MTLPPGLHGELLATTTASRRTFAPPCRSAVVTALLLVALFLVGGCGEDESHQQAAYQEAVAAVAREKQTLKNVRNEQQLVYGEYLLNEFEAHVWAGGFSFSGVLQLPWARDEYERVPPLYTYLRNKLPLGWFGQFDRLLSEKPEALPWYDRTAGELQRRRIQERFSRVLNVLHERIVLQEDRVKKSEEYARLIEPESATK